MAIDGVQTTSAVDASGNSYTTAISNDQLTNDDFMQMMIAELKMQDPTKPMDSDKMLDDQMKMSTLDTNMQMAESMNQLAAAYNTSSFASAANLIDHIVTNGSYDDKGEEKQFKVDTIENKDGELYANVRPYSKNEDGEEVLGDLETIPLSTITKIG